MIGLSMNVNNLFFPYKILKVLGNVTGTVVRQEFWSLILRQTCFL